MFEIYRFFIVSKKKNIVYTYTIDICKRQPLALLMCVPEFEQHINLEGSGYVTNHAY